MGLARRAWSPRVSLSLYLSFFIRQHNPSWGYSWTLLRPNIGKWHPNRDPKVSPIFGTTRTPLRVLQTPLQKIGRERRVESDGSKETPLVKGRNLGKADFLTGWKKHLLSRVETLARQILLWVKKTPPCQGQKPWHVRLFYGLKETPLGQGRNLDKEEFYSWSIQILIFWHG